MRRATLPFETEFDVKKSRFIAQAFPCRTAVEARQMVKDIRQQHPDATHVVHAGVFGKAGTEFSFSDDREPKNTAGRPMLEVVKGSGITDLLVAIRYFGGTLLGTGGLVKAYGDCAKLAVDGVPTEELIERTGYEVSVGYHLYEPLKKLLVSLEASLEEKLDTAVTFSGALPSIHCQKLEADVISMSHGQAHIIFTVLSDD